MPNLKAAKKALRQSLKRWNSNKAMRRKIHDAFAEIMKMARTDKKDEAKKQIPQVFSLVDRAVKRHIFHKNKAARKKSQLSKMVAMK